MIFLLFFIKNFFEWAFCPTFRPSEVGKMIHRRCVKKYIESKNREMESDYL